MNASHDGPVSIQSSYGYNYPCTSIALSRGMPDAKVREFHGANERQVKRQTDEAMADATAHLQTALASLDRLSIRPDERATGHRFIELDLASRAIHYALINLEEWNEQ